MKTICDYENGRNQRQNISVKSFCECVKMSEESCGIDFALIK